jgi:glycosyltransferase involved in cell wall biosynthesis
LHGLVHALARVGRASPAPWHLVLAGDYAQDSFHGCYREIVALIGQLGLRDRVTFTGFIPEGHLPALYQAATLLVLPSFDEGFGLPAVEAMACGLPVAASRRGSLPEVLGPAGLFFDPEDWGDMTAAVLALLGDPCLRERLGAEGRRRAGRFSWKAAADGVVRLFEETAGAPAQAA